jgi:hypothetical protein
MVSKIFDGQKHSVSPPLTGGSMSFCSLAHNSPPGQMPVLALMDNYRDEDGILARTLRNDREKFLA